MSNLDTFITAYIASALWSTNDESDDRGGEPMDANYSSSDLSNETVIKIRQECELFLLQAEDLIASDDPILSGDGTDRWSHAGHDFQLTRNGHGAGFWDGDWPINGDALSKLADTFGESNLYVGDDGQIYS